MYSIQVVSTIPSSPRAVSLEWLPLWEQQVEHVFQGQERCEEPLIAWDQFQGQLVVLLMTSSNKEIYL